MTHTPLSLLHENPVFRELDKDTLELLVSRSIVREYAPNSLLAMAGDVWPYLLLVVKGKMVLLKESLEGRALAITELGRGELFWGPAFFKDGLLNPVSMRFTQHSRLMLWQREAIVPILVAHGDAGWELSKQMMDRMMQASDIITGLAFQPVAGRLANFLIGLSSPAESGPIGRDFTLEEMAMRIGSTREMVCRFLQRFAEQGYISITRTELEIIDRDQLARLAQEERAK